MSFREEGVGGGTKGGQENGEGGDHLSGFYPANVLVEKARQGISGSQVDGQNEEDGWQVETTLNHHHRRTRVALTSATDTDSPTPPEIDGEGNACYSPPRRKSRL